MSRPAGWLMELSGWSTIVSPDASKTCRRLERQFWNAITKGVISENATIKADVSSAVRARWFLQGGGMPAVTLIEHSSRYL